MHQLMSPAEPICLVTGASSGIGAALARTFAHQGHALVLTARREAPLKRLADEIAAAGHTRPQVITADLAAPEGIAALSRELSERELEPSYLVNNAGFGAFGAAAEIALADQLKLIDLDVRALTDLTLRFADSVTRHRGGILNVASIAGFLPGPGMAAYHAAKAYVISFTDALHQEMGAEGVKVCALCPGPVETEFFDLAGIPAGYFPAFLARSPERVARAGYEGLMTGHRIVVPGKPNRVITLLPRLLPRGLVAAGSAWRWRRAVGRRR
jgi:uncharacterized protein